MSGKPFPKRADRRRAERRSLAKFRRQNRAIIAWQRERIRAAFLAEVDAEFTRCYVVGSGTGEPRGIRGDA